MIRSSAIAMAIVLAGLGAPALAGAHDNDQHHHGPAAAGAAGTPRSYRTTMEELHRTGGVPRGWTFALPAGDAARGRRVYADLECYKCHAIAGESFPAASPDPKNVGPDLTGMGAHHPAEYFAESILLPNRVIVDGPGYVGPDGRSTMPSFADSLSVTQLADLVAFIKSQTAGGMHAGGTGGERRVEAGEYAIRLVFEAGHRAHDHAMAGMAGPMAAAPATATGKGHLLAFVVDRDADESVPYLPVTATVQAAGTAPRTVRLQPMAGPLGFYYGADVELPPGTERITVNIGRATVPVVGRARYASPVTATFDWGAVSR